MSTSFFPELPPLATIKEVIKVTGISDSTLRVYIKRGDLRAYKVAGRRRIMIRREDVEALLKPVKVDSHV